MILITALFLTGVAAADEDWHLDALPPDYHLQACDDGGTPGLQPHVVGGDIHTFGENEVPAGDEKARSVAWDWQHLDLRYDGLDPAVPYAVAVTYANEPFNNRVQSFWAGDIRLHGPRPLPKGGVERLLFRVPPAALRDGTLVLSCRLEAQVNVVVSVVELWAPRPSPQVLHLRVGAAPYVGLTGRAYDLACDPLPGAEVTLEAGGRKLAAATSGKDGSFAFPPNLLAGLADDAEAKLTARAAGAEATATLPAAGARFEPIRYRPVPERVGGLKQCVLSLDGAWKLATQADARDQPLSDAVWQPFKVPGQFKQQGYDLPPDKPVALATEFTVPAAWAGQRLILRFDAVHGSADYRVNGTLVGHSDHLFTPVELDVTAAAKPGETNRLDLGLLVSTPSERLSIASGYAFHSLGGIPRKVRLFALPVAHLRSLRLAAGLDDALTTGELSLDAGIEGGGGGMSLAVSLAGPSLARPLTAEVPVGAGSPRPSGHPDAHDAGTTATGGRGNPAPTGGTEPVVALGGLLVPHVQPWTAETPHLYDLTLDLKQGDRLLERVVRRVGFKRIEVRGRQIYLNGRRIKLAGACHHEIDPLTGRADTARHAEEDIRLMRGANLNYLRTSHYPPTEELLEAADRQGIYVEVEAPFCWVSATEEVEQAREVLTPTAAMVDFCADHPSVLLWSLANESAFNPVFELADRMVKELDATHPVTFNHAFSREEASRCVDIANLHYPGYPYDALLPADPRPLILDEYWFPVCHEQTDVRVNPGLRELWGMGQAEPDSAWAQHCAESYAQPMMLPGARPGTWSAIVHSERVVGGSIWAALDDSFYFADGTHAGYSWHHGYWGLMDAWRRPKPEWFAARQIFSPVWFSTRHVPFAAGQRSVSLPVENRYSFTDFAALRFTWASGEQRGTLHPQLAPGAAGVIELPVPGGTQPGGTVMVRAERDGVLVASAAITLGEQPAAALPEPDAGPPLRRDEGTRTTLNGEGFTLTLDRSTGALDAGSTPLRRLPQLHISRYDYGDLNPGAPRYALLPDPASRQVESVALTERRDGLEIVVTDRYDGFAGTVTWLLDRRGVGRLSYDYAYSGPELHAREVGVKLLLRPDCTTLSWQRWSEWGPSDADDISRPAGRAHARREAQWPDQPEGRPPHWPWALDQTELGTNDFRGIKFNVRQATLAGPHGSVTLHARADRHARACLDPDGLWLHLITDCRMGPIVIRPGERLRGSFAVSLTR